MLSLLVSTSNVVCLPFWVLLVLLSQKVLQWSEALAKRKPSLSSASFTLFPLSDESRELWGDRLKLI